MARLILIALVALLTPNVASGQDSTVWTGHPDRKVELGGSGVFESNLDGDQAFEFEVRIVERNGRYYWASRGGKEMRRSVSGAYTTYHAVDGSGYVRVIDPELLEALSSLPGPETGDEDPAYHYVEHLTLGLGSITYYGYGS